MKTWLITGATGFLGRHVLELVRSTAAPEDRIHTTRRRQSAQPDPNLVHSIDLTDPEAIHRALAEIQPDLVLHLAGLTPPAPAAELYRANLLGTLHLLDGLNALNRPVRVALAGSAAELGPVAIENLPVGEDYEPRPLTAYGRSKHLATQAARSYRLPLEVCIARIFNVTGPGAPTNQAFGRFAADLAACPVGAPTALQVGPLDSCRDFVDVRDVAQALIAMARHGHPGSIYHVGTGRSVSVGEGLEELIRLSGRNVRILAECSVTRDDSRADASRLRADVGWSPQYEFADTMADLWREARARLDCG